MNPVRISVIICTHNPNTNRITRVLRALMRQTIDPDTWELLVVDNASIPSFHWPDGPGDDTKLRIVSEPMLGLTFARRRGVAESKGEFLLFVDDDNVLEPDYLAQVLAAFHRLPRVGALGGKSLGEFSAMTEPWHHEFYGLLAVRDLGSEEIYSLPPTSSAALKEYPTCAPIGAGMAVRRAALESWIAAAGHSKIYDRMGAELSSAGDNDLILHVLRAGWAVAYIPGLVLTHLIPGTRLHPQYLARLNHGIQKSWMQVLRLHSINPWPAIPKWSVPLRRWKAWLVYRAWRNPSAYIRWQGACGHFEGRIAPS
jgi:glycosyltransferase involved in cell wall biosynthesis